MFCVYMYVCMVHCGFIVFCNDSKLIIILFSAEGAVVLVVWIAASLTLQMNSPSGIVEQSTMSDERRGVCLCQSFLISEMEC